MIRNLEKRLRKLESKLPPPERSEEEKSRSVFFFLLVAAVGFYFGDPKPGEPPAAAFARALGYEFSGELLKAMKRDHDPEFNEKYARANQKLFAKFGVNPEAADPREFSEALERIYAGLSESYKKLAVPPEIRPAYLRETELSS